MGRIAWVTGAGSGIGEAVALGLAEDGYELVLTGRRREALAAVAHRIKEAGGRAHVKPADLTRAAAVQKIVDWIGSTLGRLDLLVNNAGLNIEDRAWAKLSPEGIDAVIDANLKAAFYCARAVLPLMRAQGGGLLIHTASMAGRFVSPLSGPAYTAAKHGVVAMSHSINMEECGNGIRSTVMCPGEVNTPILDKRPNKLSAEERAAMAQPEDCARLVRFIAAQPPHICINEVLITPTRNRSYLAALARKL
ncbi:MAG: SDR family oxidoreductase [Rhodovarius sp.]|nr:SDR family oxidoreductase [Rhodovarius sp.]MCX7932898.1 SDR family oxidoreductase [Rhodovarius sp.]MDW8313634.1 SDR family oxidoreductase [Rhodovarius sp.]